MYKYRYIKYSVRAWIGKQPLKVMRGEKLLGNKIKKRILNGLFGFTIILTLTVVCKTEANAGVSGKGTFDNPYIVDDYKGLNHVLTGENKDKIYIGINGQIEITKNINVSVGEYVIFAYSEDAQIYKSHKVKAEINNPEDLTYCMHVGRYGDTRIEFGTEGNYELILSGKKSKFKEKGIVSSGWMYIYKEGSVVIGEKTKVENMMNNDVDSNLSNITVFGCLDVYGKITKCEGENGGAICGKGTGIVNIHSPSIITNCSSKTEGGAIWIKESSTLTMKGGTITSCAASEEGGGLCISGNSSKV